MRLTWAFALLLAAQGSWAGPTVPQGEKADATPVVEQFSAPAELTLAQVEESLRLLDAEREAWLQAAGGGASPAMAHQQAMESFQQRRVSLMGERCQLVGDTAGLARWLTQAQGSDTGTPLELERQAPVDAGGAQ